DTQVAAIVQSEASRAEAAERCDPIGGWRRARETGRARRITAQDTGDQRAGLNDRAGGRVQADRSAAAVAHRTGDHQAERAQPNVRSSKRTANGQHAVFENTYEEPAI